MSFIRKKVHAYLSECFQGLQGRVKNVTQICSGEINEKNATQIAWALLAELQAILALCLTCARAVRGCPTEATPSGTPGGGGGPSTVRPSNLKLDVKSPVQVAQIFSGRHLSNAV